MLQHHERSSLLVLPPELKVPIFANLEATDIAKLRMVCSHLAVFIKETPELQYKIELAICGMVNGPPDGPPLLDRLQSLRKYHEAWKTGSLPIKPILPPLRSKWRSTAGVIVYFSDSGSMLVIHRPASAFSGITEKTWTIAPACLNSPTAQTDFELKLVAVDVSQDLVILTQEDGYGIAEGHILSLSHNGAPHPLAERPVTDITLHTSPRSVQEGDVEIVGDFVRWQRYGEECTILEVWNWKLGRIVWRHDSSLEDGLCLRGCHILDSSHILAMDRTSLFLCSIAHTDQAPLPPPTEGRVLLRLRMPSTADGVSLRLRSRSRLQRSNSSVDGGHSFHGDPSLAILALDISLYKSDDASIDYEIPVLIVPLTSIYGVLRHFCLPPSPTRHGDPSLVDVAWDIWGPSCARMFLIHGRVKAISTMDSQCAIVFGGKHYTKEYESKNVLVVDVRASAQPGPTVGENFSSGDLRQCLDYPKLFESPIHTTLPCCISRTPRPMMHMWSRGSLDLLQDTVLHIQDPGPSPEKFIAEHIRRMNEERMR